MFRALVLILQLVGVSLLGAGPVWFIDHHGPIGWHTRLLFWHPGFELPDSLAVQRDKARQALQTAQDGENRCRAAIDSQNASIAVLSAKSTAALARSEHDVEAARAVAESLRQSSAALSVYVPKGADECARWDDADRAVVGSLK